MTTDYYGQKLEELQRHRGAVKRRKLCNATYLWAEDGDGSVWDERVHGPLLAPRHIHVSLFGNTILTWNRGETTTEFPSASISATTKQRIWSLTNFRVYTRGDVGFIQMRGGRALPYPRAGTLCNETGRLVQDCDTWLNDFDAYDFYNDAPRLAGQLTAALLGGKSMGGWDDHPAHVPWTDEQGCATSPDTVQMALQFREDGVPSLPLILAALERKHSMTRLERVIKSLRPGETFQRTWRVRTLSGQPLLDHIADELRGVSPVVYRLWGVDILRPRDLYQALKKEITIGLLSAAGHEH